MRRVWYLALFCAVFLFIGFIVFYVWKNFPEEDPIKIGIIHSLTGTLAISETSLVDALLLEVKRVNNEGGLLGRRVEAIVVDGKSDWPTFAHAAERLISEENVSVVFGCWTSACRKTVKPIFEEHNHLLMYPVQYEGLEESPNIIYTGAAPNQQITPAVKWSIDNLGKKIFLVGSDYVFPRTANEIIREHVDALDGEIVGEEYILLGDKDVGAVVEKIVEAQPEVILNSLNGDSNIAFFKQLSDAGVTSDDIPVMSFSVAEDELRAMDVHDMVGNYAAWNYFQSIDSEENDAFVQRFKNEYGLDRVTDDPIEASYLSFNFWKQAVREAGTDDVDAVRREIKGQCLDAPEGTVCIDSENNHTWKVVRIGKIDRNGQFDIVWSSDKSVQPEPYPVYRFRADWDAFLEGLFMRWKGNWSNLGT